jgi:hypothetical protein
LRRPALGAAPYRHRYSMWVNGPTFATQLCGHRRDRGRRPAPYNGSPGKEIGHGGGHLAIGEHHRRLGTTGKIEQQAPSRASRGGGPDETGMGLIPTGDYSSSGLDETGRADCVVYRIVPRQAGDIDTYPLGQITKPMSVGRPWPNRQTDIEAVNPSSCQWRYTGCDSRLVEKAEVQIDAVMSDDGVSFGTEPR